jgi:hypothetical protein
VPFSFADTAVAVNDNWRSSSFVLDRFGCDRLTPQVIHCDFLFGFFPTTGVGLFRDFLPAPQICKSFFQSTLGFSLAKGALR